ncbi:MAG: hypothetical protein ACLR4A_10385 [Christensenellales bacterium]
MGFFKSKKGSIISDYFSIETDLGQFRKGNAVDVALFPDHLELQNAIGNKKTATLAYSQITDIFTARKRSCSSRRNPPSHARLPAGCCLGAPALLSAHSAVSAKRKRGFGKLSSSSAT